MKNTTFRKHAWALVNNKDAMQMDEIGYKIPRFQAIPIAQDYKVE